MEKFIPICFILISCMILNEANLIKNDDKVKVSVYYESKCPDSAAFINGQLTNAFNHVLDITNIILYPFGKANYTKNDESGLWNFLCQHGNDECYGNMIHNCFIEAYPKVEDHFKFLNCCMTDIRTSTLTVALQCANSLNINLDSVIQCVNGTRGNELLYQTGVETNEKLNPKLNYVPWININDVHSNENQNEAEKVDLVGLVCQTYKGTKKPKACNGSLILKANFSFLTIILYYLIFKILN